MAETPPTAPRVIPASTVVVFRHGAAGKPPEILMVQRAKEMRFAGGAAVFPGGRVDPEDWALADVLAAGEDMDIAAARIAGIRETLEETGLMIATQNAMTAEEAAEARVMLLERGALAPVLEHFGWRLALDRLEPFAHWCPQWDGAFDTRFFLADLGTGAVNVAVDATENTRLFWASATDALAMADAGEISVIFPTRRNLERLALFSSFSDARDQARAFPVRKISPSQQERDGEAWLTIPDDLGYPVTAQRLTTVQRG